MRYHPASILVCGPHCFVAMQIHPDDERYRHAHGRHVVHPFTGERLPVVLDPELVDMAKGA